MRVPRNFALFASAAMLAVALVPLAPAATTAPLPMLDTFDVDSIASGDWNVIKDGPMTISISNGDLLLALNASGSRNGGGISRPVPPLASPAILETHFKMNTVYRFGAAFRAPNSNPTVIIEATNFGFSLSYHNAGGSWTNSLMGVSAVANKEYITRLTLNADKTAVGEVFDGAGVLLGRATASNMKISSSAVTFIDVNVWRDTSSNPLSSTLVHQVALSAGPPATQLLESRAVSLPAIPSASPGYIAAPNTPVGTGLGFTLDMANMAHKPSGDTYQLALDVHAQGTAIAPWTPPAGTRVANVYWNDQGPFPMTAQDFQPRPGGFTFGLSSVAIDAAAVRSGPNDVLIVPAPESGVSSWDLTFNRAIMELAAAPVFLIHGWTPSSSWVGPPSDPYWTEAARGHLAASALAHLGRDPWAWFPGQEFPAFGYDPKQRIATSSVEFTTAILGYRSAHGYDGKVGIVAHSMGGLVAREMIEQGAGADLVAGLVTIGTPHLGAGEAIIYTELLDNKHTFSGGFYVAKDGSRLYTRGGYQSWWDPDISAYRRSDNHESVADFEIYPDYINPYIKTRKPTFAINGDVPYFLLAGEPNIRYTSRPGDDITATRSATFDWTDRACWKVHKNLPAYTVALHNELPERYVILQDAMLFLTWGQASGVCQNRPVGVASIMNEPDASGTADGEGERPAVHATILAGESASATFRLVNSQVAEFTLAKLATEIDTTFELRSPSGVTFTSESHAAYEEVGGMMTKQRYLLDAPEDGEWTLIASRDNVSEESLGVVFTAFYESSVRLAEAPSSQSFGGLLASIVVRLTDSDGSGISGATVVAEVTHADTGLALSVDLVDDGLHGDGAAGDGLYGGYYALSTPGFHPAVVTATGQATSGAFEETLLMGVLIE